MLPAETLAGPLPWGTFACVLPDPLFSSLLFGLQWEARQFTVVLNLQPFIIFTPVAPSQQPGGKYRLTRTERLTSEPGTSQLLFVGYLNRSKEREFYLEI